MSMDRRGFLGSLMVVTAAVASGVKLPSGKEVARAAPKAIAVSNRLIGLLKDCHVTCVTKNMNIDGPVTYEIDYIHSPGSKKNETTQMVDGYTKGMRPVSVRFTEAVGELTRVHVEWM